MQGPLIAQTGANRLQEVSKQLTDKSAPIDCLRVKKAVVVTLNRERVLNALNVEMTRELNRLVRQWHKDEDIRYAIFRGRGRAFCAGGDIAAIYRHHTQEKNLIDHEFYDEINFCEFALYHNIAKMRPKQISFLDGYCFGGGCCLALFSRYVVVTERTQMAMPEAGIGYFCDAGAHRFLRRLPDGLGLYYAMTGKRLTGAQMLSLGLAHFLIQSSDVEDVVRELLEASELQNHQEEVEKVLRKYSEKPSEEEGAIANAEEIRELFTNMTSYSHFLQRLEESNSRTAHEMRHYLRRQSPLSLRIIYERLQIQPKDDFRFAFLRDVRIGHWMQEEGDFFEGARVTLVDKKDVPRWKYRSPRDITDSIVTRIMHTSLDEQSEKKFCSLLI